MELTDDIKTWISFQTRDIADAINQKAQDHFKKLGRDYSYNEIKAYRKAIIAAFNERYALNIFCGHAVELNIEFVDNPKIEMTNGDAYMFDHVTHKNK